LIGTLQVLGEHGQFWSKRLSQVTLTKILLMRKSLAVFKVVQEQKVFL
jgi:hypothetical protein